MGTAQFPILLSSLRLTPERKEALRDPDVSPRLHLDQFRPVIRILSEIREDSALSDMDLPHYDKLIYVIHSVAAQDCSSPVAPPLYEPLPDLQDYDSNY
jgi:hypothetical protein